MGLRETRITGSEHLPEEGSSDGDAQGRVARALPPNVRQALHAWAERNRVRRGDPAWAIAELFLVLSEAAALRLHDGTEDHVVARAELASTLAEVDVRVGEGSQRAEAAAARVADRVAAAERAAHALQGPLQAALRRLEPERTRHYRYLATLLLALTAGAFFAGDRYRASRTYERLPVGIAAEPATSVAGEVLTRHLYWALDEGGRADLRAFVARASADSVRLSERGGHLVVERGGRRVVVEHGAER